MKVLQGIGRAVIVLGVVSLLTDISSEMLYPIIPLFLTGVLHAPMMAVGLIEGIAESTASLLKGVAGWYSDRLRRRRPFLFIGYGLSAIAKPLLALATAWPLVLIARFVDRTGKGVRSSPRDVIIAASCDAAHRGKAFGLHRAMDTIGALIGPVLAMVLLSRLKMEYSSIFLVAFIPAALGVALLVMVPREAAAPEAVPVATEAPPAATPVLSPELRGLLVVVGVFALGNSSDVFLILKAKQAGLSATLVLGTYVLYNAVYALMATPAGWLSDRLSRRALLVSGLVVFALVYLGFAAATSTWMIWPLFALYGCYAAANEGVVKAYVTDLSTPATRGTAQGLVQTVTGVMALVASSIAGLLWSRVSPAAPFVYAAVCALAAAVLLGVLCRPRVVPTAAEAA